MKCYSLVIDPKLVKEIDRLVKEHGLFSSRSDFIRDAIRARLFEVKKTILGKEAKEKVSGKELAREEKLVDEAMEEVEEYKFGGVH
jgi:Arc/MetJ-type ribon-helix-helix transcriptional regulator